jgi:hypothetical protein
MAEKEYIERGALVQYAKEHAPAFSAVFEIIALSVPTADVVEVVRCKDCKHLKKNEILAAELTWCRRFAESVKPDGFCSFGKREEQE